MHRNPNNRPMKNVICLLLLVFQLDSCIEADSCSCDGRRKLQAVLYPFIPAKAEFFWYIEHAFEASHTNIDLEIIDLGENYYDSSKPSSITGANADVYELDAVFLADFILNKKLQPFKDGTLTEEGTYLKHIRMVPQFQGQWYGVPHWACGNFLFFRTGDSEIRSANTLADLERVIGVNHSISHGVLVDLKGKLTLGEMYLDAAFDHYATWSEVQSKLQNLEPTIQSDLARLLNLCDKGFGRNQHYHEASGFYGRQYARMGGRAMIGYSESLFYSLSEIADSCIDKQCLSALDIDVKSLPLDDRGSHSVSWVDLLTIDQRCSGDKLADAIALINFLNRDEVILHTLLPEFPRPGRYLLPAKASLYNNQALLTDMPLYTKLREIIEESYSPVTTNLNETLRALGKKLDGSLPDH